MNPSSAILFAPVFALAALSSPEAPSNTAPASIEEASMQGGEQDPDREPVPPSCPKRKSVITPGSPASSTSTPTTTCEDGTACGYVLTYNPPSTECQATTAMLCCVEQLQRAYTQSFSCQPGSEYPHNTVCTGGTKNPFGSTHVVYVTVPCVEHGGGYKCADPDEY